MQVHEVPCWSAPRSAVSRRGAFSRWRMGSTHLGPRPQLVSANLSAASESMPADEVRTRFGHFRRPHPGVAVHPDELLPGNLTLDPLPYYSHASSLLPPSRHRGSDHRIRGRDICLRICRWRQCRSGRCHPRPNRRRQRKDDRSQPLGLWTVSRFAACGSQ